MDTSTVRCCIAWAERRLATEQMSAWERHFLSDKLARWKRVREQSEAERTLRYLMEAAV